MGGTSVQRNCKRCVENSRVFKHQLKAGQHPEARSTGTIWPSWGHQATECAGLFRQCSRWPNSGSLFHMEESRHPQAHRLWPGFHIFSSHHIPKATLSCRNDLQLSSTRVRSSFQPRSKRPSVRYVDAWMFVPRVCHLAHGREKAPRRIHTA